MYILLLILYATIPVLVRVPLFKYIYPKRLFDPAAWGKRQTIKEFFYTAFIFGPIFCLERIFMGGLIAGCLSPYYYGFHGGFNAIQI